MRVGNLRSHAAGARPRGLRGGASWWGVAAIAAVVGAGAVGYKVLFDRPGELAIGFMPADAQAIITVDLSPSPAQAQTFKAIGDALKQEGLLDELEKEIAEAAAQNELVREIRPHIKNSFAVGVWGIEEGKEPKYAALLMAVGNPGAVSSSLEKHLRGYRLEGEQAYVIDKKSTAAVLGNYLIISPNEESMRRVIAVKAGKSPSAADLAAYQEARKALPDDANAMLFVSNSLLREAGKEAERELKGANPFRHNGWFAAGLAIRNEGLLCSVRAPFSADEVKEMQPLANLPVLSLDSLGLLPRGAYGLAALSQPAALYDTLRNFALAKPESKREMEEGLAKFRSETGFDLEKDVVPAFRGEFTVALYPSQVPGNDDPDALFIADDANGADPATFIEKLRLAIDSGRFDKGGPKARFSSQPYGTTTIHLLDVSGDPNAKGKTPCYAILGKTVVASTSLTLLKQVVDSSGSDANALRSDPRFKRMVDRGLKAGRFTLMADLPTLMKDAAEKDRGPAWDWHKLFGDDGLTFSASYDGKTTTAELFVPLDWVELVHRIGAEAKKNRNAPGPSADMAF